MGLHDLSERPQTDAVAVRKRAALPPSDDLTVCLDGLHQFIDKPALADSWNANQRHQLR